MSGKISQKQKVYNSQLKNFAIDSNIVFFLRDIHLGRPIFLKEDQQDRYYNTLYLYKLYQLAINKKINLFITPTVQNEIYKNTNEKTAYNITDTLLLLNINELNYNNLEEKKTIRMNKLYSGQVISDESYGNRLFNKYSAADMQIMAECAVKEIDLITLDRHFFIENYEDYAIKDKIFQINNRYQLHSSPKKLIDVLNKHYKLETLKIKNGKYSDLYVSDITLRNIKSTDIINNRRLVQEYFRSLKNSKHQRLLSKQGPPTPFTHDCPYGDSNLTLFDSPRELSD